MENKLENAVNSFIEKSDDENNETLEKNVVARKKVVLSERSGLIERLDKQYVTEDGRILLREQY